MNINTNLQFRLELIHEIANVDDDNIDAIVHFDNGKSFGITFFTKKNISTLCEAWNEAEECLKGAYFWAVDCVIVEKLEYLLLVQVVADMLKCDNNVFEKHFTKIICPCVSLSSGVVQEICDPLQPSQPEAKTGANEK